MVKEPSVDYAILSPDLCVSPALGGDQGKIVAFWEGRFSERGLVLGQNFIRVSKTKF